MSLKMEDEIKRWTTKRKSAFVLDPYTRQNDGI
ncbi:transposase [Pandoraea iniqua]|uniref:Transposase n=1 Tax=Pandoraea iniqua TaxID=2508288 RepID=A0A5E4YJ90_9BURK|nr:transposase [Pandoraea iniqua]